VNQFSMDFDGVDEVLRTGASPLGITGAHSIAFWFKTTDTASVTHIVSKDAAGGVDRDLAVLWRGVTLRYILYLFWDASGNQSQLTSSANLYDDDVWRLCVCTWDGTAAANGMKIWINGSIDTQGTAASAGPLRTNVDSMANTLGIGATPNNINQFDGNINLVGLFKRELTGTEISNMYNGGTPVDMAPFSPDFYWPIGNGGAWDGIDWSFTDEIAGVNMTSVNMEFADVVADVP